MRPELVEYLLKTFASSGELHAWLCVQVWPAFKERDKQTRMNNATRHNTASRSAAVDLDSISQHATAPDGTALTVREVERRADAGEPVRSNRTGQIVRWTGRKWEPYT
jgi:hypothetical protein